MESINDLVSGAQAYGDMIVVAIAAGMTWLTARFEWWKSQNKFVRVFTAAGLFVVFMLVLSVLNAVFT